MKKAISPLISTVILIVFATILGVMVMGWGKDYDPGSLSSCQDASLKIITLDGKPMACYSDGILYATVENDGQTVISGLRISAIGEEIMATPLDVNIPVAIVTRLELPIDSTSIPLKVLITPMVENTFCPKNQAEIEYIRIC